VGKSTLLNRVIGEKLAIATPRPQTTRNRLLAVKNVGGAQLALVDTPGLHSLEGPGRTALNEFMVEEALRALQEVDVVLVMTDPRGFVGDAGAGQKAGGEALVGAADHEVARRVLEAGKPVVVAINKTDLVADKLQILPLIERWSQTGAGQVRAVVPISALTGDGVERLVAELVAALPEGPSLFPEEMLTDRAERFLVAEFIREQVFLATHKEVPYAVAVTIESWQERTAERGRRKGERVGITIHATVHVEKEAQKKIVVGAGGRVVRDVGTAARAEIARLLQCPVHLELFVRVDPKWSLSAAGLRKMGYGEEEKGQARRPREKEAKARPRGARP
jgi:GTP-binding protein Era